MRYKNLLFDVDNTLIDFNYSQHEAFKLMFAELGFDYTEEAEKLYEMNNLKLWKAYEQGTIAADGLFNHRFANFFADLGVDADGERAEHTYRKYLMQQYPLIDHSDQILAQLSQTASIYAVTNGIPEVQYTRLRDSGLDQYLQGIFISAEMGVQKPAPEFFEIVFAAIPDFSKAQTIIIGDSLTSDIQGANNSGIASVWFNPQGLARSKGGTPDYEIRKLSELFEILQ